MQGVQNEQSIERGNQMQLAMVASQAVLERRYQEVQDVDYADVVAQVALQCRAEHEMQYEQAAQVQQQQIHNFEET